MDLYNRIYTDHVAAGILSQTATENGLVFSGINPVILDANDT